MTAVSHRQIYQAGIAGEEAMFVVEAKADGYRIKSTSLTKSGETAQSHIDKMSERSGDF